MVHETYEDISFAKTDGGTATEAVVWLILLRTCHLRRLPSPGVGALVRGATFDILGSNLYDVPGSFRVQWVGDQAAEGIAAVQ